MSRDLLRTEGREELWAIMDFAQPSLLSSKADFKARYEEPIERRGPEGDQAAQGLLAALGNHYLRRTKEEELADQLPNKTHQVFEAPMSPQQFEIYDAVRRWYVATQQGPLPAISGLIMACAHPLAVNPDVLEAVGYSKSFTQETQGAELMEMSAKFAYLREALEHVASAGEKAILFTRFKDLQLLLQRFLTGEFKIHPRIVNGEVAGNSRQSLIDRFNEGKGFGCIIMSTDAAGVGVNVTGANHVFHVTRPWNPAKEMQATDRAYRIGQTRDVTVHLPVVMHPTLNSLDKLLHDLLESKRELATQVIRPSGSLDITWEDLEEGLGTVASHETVESVLPSNLPSFKTPELVLNLLESPVLRERLDRHGVQGNDLKVVLSFALEREGRTTVSQLARCMNRDESRVARMISPLMNVLNRDGYMVLRREEGLLHLNKDLLHQQFA
ncbi:DEAD/DEAH box helicase [Microvenator marinus]|uniref:DEAD/DEAH box helicase n=1 Tax=Microvenator marinus TaxID=2600177 RepID=A0A5B8XV25_9DELT|nr:DEAD/DEAH box helicase [Microvenator marinus]QED29470.1 DEAD/DEAH box helicase [Microvenator marinus]